MDESRYYQYLKSLDKKELIALIYEKKKRSKPIPSKSYRTVALRLSYDGTGFSGTQEHDFIRSIEGELNESLRLSGIGESPVFAGRTDGGVSAVNMIVSISAKSRWDSPNRTYVLNDQDKEEYPYDKILNERLPDAIRVTGWAPVPDSFNARHSCIQRTYKYYFLLKEMDLARMKEAAEMIKTMKNFYKLSTHSNPRAIYDRSIEELTIEKDEEDIYCLTIKAKSFLHNMVRKIVWLIKKYGGGGEFSLEQVRIAEPFPLVFVGAKYTNELQFIGNRFSQSHFVKDNDRLRILQRIARLRLETYDS